MKTAGQKEGAGLLERVTPGPYEVVKGRHTPEIAHCGATLARLCAQPIGDIHANAELFALAYDHALLLRALTMGAASWDADAGRGCVLWGPHAGLIFSDLDASGCPAMSEPLRAALRKVVDPRPSQEGSGK